MNGKLSCTLFAFSLIPFQCYMSSNFSLRTIFNTISHELRAQIVIRSPSYLYCILHINITALMIEQTSEVQS